MYVLEVSHFDRMKIYIHLETGATYRLGDTAPRPDALPDVESQPLSYETNTQGGATLIDTDIPKWSPLNPYETDLIPHEGSEYAIGEFENIIRKILTA